MSETKADVTGWLDRLAETHKAAVVQRHNYPSLPWLRVDPEDGSVVEAVWSDGGHMPYVDCFDHESADAIVAAHNALPQLVAAVRGALALADKLDEPVFRAAIYEGEHIQGRHEGEDAQRVRDAAAIRDVVAAALGAEVAGR